MSGEAIPAPQRPIVGLLTGPPVRMTGVRCPVGTRRCGMHLIGSGGRRPGYSQPISTGLRASPLREISEARRKSDFLFPHSTLPLVICQRLIYTML